MVPDMIPLDASILLPYFTTQSTQNYKNLNLNKCEGWTAATYHAIKQTIMTFYLLVYVAC